MWETVSNIAAIIVIILLFELLGLPGWLRGALGKKNAGASVKERLDDLESRVRELERAGK